MEESEKIWIASIAIAKQYGYETLKYSDYMYGNEEFIDDVWDYVKECANGGQIAFYEKYKEFKLY